MSELSISLFYKEGSSDKVYQAQVEPEGDGFVVKFQYGRRGAALQSGLKTAVPVSLDKATIIYDKLVQEKIAKGYSQDEAGTPYIGSEDAGKFSGLIPQLPVMTTIDEVEDLIEDSAWMMEEKMNGRHMMSAIDDNPDSTMDVKVICSNRKGLIIPGSKSIVSGLSWFWDNGDCKIEVDGEDMGDRFCLFDLLQHNNTDRRGVGAMTRYEQLRDLTMEKNFPSSLYLVRAAFNAKTKRALFNEIRDANLEGVVFKHKFAPYTPGKPSSGGTMLKWKFKGEATCQVIQQNGSKRSVEVGVGPNSEGGNSEGWLQSIGNVTISSNWEIPKPGELIEVEYLYAYPNGSLFQPVYKGPRLDKDEPDQYSTLKFKPGTEEES